MSFELTRALSDAHRDELMRRAAEWNRYRRRAEPDGSGHRHEAVGSRSRRPRPG
ncbi:hypothetical protein ACFQ34_17290 [Pseudonocardia benzenivorans]|jgi:hypothetical protein|uniref:Uncharacterized protein n=1 Tax=Pseudonocardia benzenivorans TaxID=228005 RepID=A0ABW3VK85_9PSEU|nr:hypothetical protein [Pseudonocardia dioxanivorans]